MKRRLAALLLVLCSAAQAGTYVDDRGRRVEFAAPPQRIVSLAPNLTEIVYAVGAGERLVGVDTASDYPAAARAVPRIGDYQRVDLERLVALKPDLVLVWPSGNTARELDALAAAGIVTWGLEPRRLADVPRAIERLGALLGRADAGTRRADALRGELDALRRAHAADAPVSVYYQVWTQPLLTLNDDHLVSDVVRLCGGRNVFGPLKPLVPELSTESVLAADPEAMLSAHREEAGARRAPDDAAFALWRPFKQLRAVRRGWLYSLPGDTLNRQGPRIADGARAVCDALDQVRRERDAPSGTRR